ncbi:MAG TPA: maleylpyruvate isomerase family mycothiol-dependent enzyme [Pseudonocardiaceae bacterium]|nr:maleylpyruvate isomerase family mycothiol-dependent enzyme [Pseudonocardiaceae bacterium]
MDVPVLTGALRAQGELLGAAAARTGLTAGVPSCPGWTVRDLLLHIGGVHRWAATVVREARTEPIGLEQPYDIVDELPSAGELVDWYRTGHADLVATLETAPADVACWAFMRAPTPLAFWARRQTHETAIHRVDAELAAGAAPAVAPPDVATDGIDELLTGFVPRGDRLRANGNWSLHVHATDTDTHWLVRISEDRPRVERLAGTADRSVSGPANDVYLALWNRMPWDGLDVTGTTPAALSDEWSTSVLVRWG